ncbi:hypothetical protein SARC_15516, partial [Sphaeroforma arctica JP610]
MSMPFRVVSVSVYVSVSVAVSVIVYESVIDTIKKYSTEIFADLDINIIHKEWRNREASCLAMSDLISTLQTDLTNDQFEQTWLLCVRVLDDIKVL